MVIKMKGTIETRQETLDRLKKELASCRRIYKENDGRFHIIEGYTGTHCPIIRRVKAVPAWLKPRVIIVNENPLNLVLENRVIAIDDFINKLTMDEVDYVSGLEANWQETEAKYFAAHIGSIYRYGAYVLGDTYGEIFGDRTGLRKGKVVVGVEYYDLLEEIK